MKYLQTNAFLQAQRYIGIKEVPGQSSNPEILAMLRLDNSWPANDEVAWCSAFANKIAWSLRLPRSKNLAARSWLMVGEPIPLNAAEAGFDVVVLKQSEADPGPEELKFRGHVGFFAGLETLGDGSQRVHVLGGNQGDAVSVTSFPASRVLGVRRLVA